MKETTIASSLDRPQSLHTTAPTALCTTIHAYPGSDNHVHAAEQCTAFCGVCGGDCIYTLGHAADHRCTNGHTW